MGSKVILLLLFSIFLFSFTSSLDDQSFGIVARGECIDLLQTCDNCTYSNMTAVVFPNKTIMNFTTPMTKIGTLFNYSDWCETNNVGEYIVNGVADPDGFTFAWAYTFDVTPTGQEFSTAQSIIYVFVLILSLALFFFCVWGAMRIDSDYPRDMEGNIVKVNHMKHVKHFLVVICYLIILWINFVAYKISLGYLQLSSVAQFFRFLYTFMLALVLPIFIVFVIVSFIMWVKDLKLEKLMQRGIDIQ